MAHGLYNVIIFQFNIQLCVCVYIYIYIVYYIFSVKKDSSDVAIVFKLWRIEVLIQSIAVFLLVQFINLSEAAVNFGSCPQHNSIKDFNLAKLHGNWYEIESLGLYYESYALRCNKIRFSSRSDTSVNVAVSARILWFGEWTFSSVYADHSGDGKFELTADLPVLGTYSAPLQILETDYTNYAIAWTCKQMQYVNYQIFLVLSRDRSLDEKLMEHINVKLLQKYAVNPYQLNKLDQSNCN